MRTLQPGKKMTLTKTPLQTAIYDNLHWTQPTPCQQHQGLLGAFGALAVGAIGGLGTGMTTIAAREADHSADLHNAKELKQMEIDAEADKERRVAEAAGIAHRQERQEDFAFKNDPANVRMENEAAAAKQGALHSPAEIAYQRQEALAKHIEPTDHTDYQGRADSHAWKMAQIDNLRNGGSVDGNGNVTGASNTTKAEKGRLKELYDYTKSQDSRLANMAPDDPEAQTVTKNLNGAYEEINRIVNKTDHASNLLDNNLMNKPVLAAQNSKEVAEQAKQGAVPLGVTPETDAQNKAQLAASDRDKRKTGALHRKNADAPTGDSSQAELFMKYGPSDTSPASIAMAEIRNNAGLSHDEKIRQISRIISDMRQG